MVPDSFLPTTAVFKFGDTAVFGCKEGYKLVGTETAVCGADGTFPETDADCVLGESRVESS